MDELIGLSEKQQYHLHLGELLDGLLQLETAVRHYLYLHKKGADATYWDSLTALKYGDKVEENAFTRSDSFGELIKNYNKVFAENRNAKKHQIDELIISTRNSIAHGRILPKPADGIPKLINFSRREEGQKLVVVETVAIASDDWLLSKIPLVAQEIAKVQKVLARLDPNRRA